MSPQDESVESVDRQREVYDEAIGLLATGGLLRAESLLRREVDRSPRAAQSVYLLGITLFLQERIAEARRLIDRAFELKLWVREPGVEVGLERTLGALRNDERVLDWEWLRYELLVRRWSSIGFDFPRVVSACFADQNPMILQIGANDGRSGDPLLAFLERHDWRAVLMEPLPEPFAALRRRHEQRRHTTVVNSAISDHDGRLDLFVGSAGKTTLASARPDRNALSREESALEKIQVECIRFETLFARHDIERVDLLQIDTEGMDGSILGWFDLERFRPSIVQLEFYCLPLGERIDVMQRLDANDYVWRFLERDLLAVRSDVVPSEFCVERNGLLDLTSSSGTPS